jgi:hypothetical protein
MKQRKSIFAPFSKVRENDDGSLYVEGIASTESRDEDPKAISKWGKGEIITADAVKGAIPAYMEWGAVREMHQAIAAGTAVDLSVGDDGQTRLSANIVDEGSCKKVLAKVLKGFSLGGTATKRNADDPSIIEGLKLTEISLVDRPANPDCKLEIVKCDAEEPMAKKNAKKTATPTAPAAAPAPQDELKKFMLTEVWDVQTACNVLSMLAQLVSVEEDEEHEEAESQVSDLLAAIERVKAFIVSEIQEVKEAAAKAGGVEKSGAKFSAETKKAMADHSDKLEECHKALGEAHKSLKKCHEGFGKLGWQDDDKDADAKKAAAPDDVQKSSVAASASTATEPPAAGVTTATAPVTPVVATPAADESMTKFAAIEKRMSDMEALVADTAAALTKVASERDTLADSLKSAKAELAKKGAVKIVAIEKVNDGRLPAPEAEPTDPAAVLAKVRADNAGLDEATITKIATREMMRIALDNPHEVMK